MRIFSIVWYYCVWIVSAYRLHGAWENDERYFKVSEKRPPSDASIPKLELRRFRIQAERSKLAKSLSSLLLSNCPKSLGRHASASRNHRLRTKPLLMGWEQSRSGDMDLDALSEGCQVGIQNQKFPRLHQKEYELLRRMQSVPGLMGFSLAVHYSLLPKVITPLLALIVWLFSMPRGASLITFVCASDLVNTALKWAVQRPRPRWYCPIEANSLISGCGAWEVDLSFPSAHTMFFSGLAACAATLYKYPLWPAALFGAVVGFSRNYLSMHWPTDTLMGLALGGILGSVWGAADPYAWLVARKSPILSLSFATLFTSGLISLMIASRQFVPPVDSTERTTWFANALTSLSPEERNATLADHKKHVRTRALKSKIPMLTTVWATLAMTGLYPLIAPNVINEPVGSIVRRLAQTGIGVVGLGGVEVLKSSVGKRDLGNNVSSKKAALKALTYLAICAWTFLGSQLFGNRILDAVGVA